MKREFFRTADGSLTIRLPDWDEQYHSKHGAIAEATHVFVQSGFQHFLDSRAQVPNPLRILEIGFGTGLNALLTYKYATAANIPVHYVGVEAFPVSTSEATKLQYANQLQVPEAVFEQFHTLPWEVSHDIDNDFSLEKRQQTFSEICDVASYDLIYYDAFGPRVQPELWEQELLSKMYEALVPNGVWVSYCAKGSVRRSLQDLGFAVERLPGPPGKREMLRATKK